MEKRCLCGSSGRSEQYENTSGQSVPPQQISHRACSLLILSISAPFYHGSHCGIGCMLTGTSSPLLPPALFTPYPPNWGGGGNSGS